MRVFHRILIIFKKIMPYTPLIFHSNKTTKNILSFPKMPKKPKQKLVKKLVPNQNVKKVKKE